MDCSRRDFLFAGVGAGAILAADSAFGGVSPSSERKLKGFAPLDVKRITVKVGAKQPFKVFHVSDTHIVRAEKSDGDAKVRLAAARYPQMGYGEHYLWEAVTRARADGAMLVHTGDMIDFVSKANLNFAGLAFGTDDWFVSAGNHEYSRFVGEARELVNSFKFNGALYLRDDFADFLEAATRSRFRIEEIAFVAPMPSSPINRFYRGYNQCRYLADALADRIGVREVPDTLRRVGSFRKQSELGAAERRQNVKGTFAVTRSGARALAAAGKEKAVLVVDDIMTTGSTLSECARTLKAAGAGKVWCVTLARTVSF